MSSGVMGIIPMLSSRLLARAGLFSCLSGEIAVGGAIPAVPWCKVGFCWRGGRSFCCAVKDCAGLLRSAMLGGVLKKGDIVIYESTVYPGCTEEDCVPVLEKCSGLKFNEDFFCGYSPERINPGDKENTLTTIKKITSGSTPEIADIVDELYNSII